MISPFSHYLAMSHIPCLRYECVSQLPNKRKNLLGEPGRPSEEQERIAVRYAAESTCYRLPRSYTWPSFVTCVIPMYQAGLLTQASALYPVFPVSQ